MLRRALRLVDRRPGPEVAGLRVRILLSLAHNEAERGRMAQARELLEDAESALDATSDERLAGIFHGQRGLMSLRGGDLLEARRHLDIAATVLDDADEQRAIVLINRGMLLVLIFELRAAAADLRTCADLAERNGQAVLRAMALHNLGLVAFLGGDLVAGLRLLDQARARIAELAPTSLGVCDLDRARILRDAGLLTEAEAALVDAAASMRENHLDHDLAEVDLERAEVALLSGRRSDALAHARSARRRLRRRGNRTWSLLADLVRLQADLLAPLTRPKLPSDARAVAVALAEAGLVEDAQVAGLVGLRAALRTGAASEPPPITKGQRIGTRLLTRLVRAEIARGRGEPLAEDAELRRGLRELRRHRSRFGSLDLATASALHGHDLARRGLANALRSGRPAAVHAWIERTRALSLQLAPARPPEDEEAAEELAELRAVRAALRIAELDGSVDPDLHARRSELERSIRQRSWHTGGADERPAEERPTTLGDVRDAVGDGVVVSYLVVEGTVHALVAGRRGARLVGLAPLDDVRGALRRVHADLDAAALAVLPPAVRDVVRGSLAAGLNRLDELLWRPLAARAGSGALLVVPTGELAAVPWTLLPGCRGRPVTVAPSATWWSAHRVPPASDGRLVLAAGPGLRRADEEVRVVAADGPGATALTGRRATAAAVLDAAAGAGVLHLAAHGRHEPDNPLFSSIELADGPLFGYDLPRAAALPPHVVLSACDLGLVVERPGDESLGMTSALLHGGVSSVVAGVARVNDDVACQLMIAYHAALRSGRLPSEALADALAATGSDQPDHPAPFVVVGAGW